MSTVSELDKSRDSGETGIGASDLPSRLFWVVVDSESQDPETVLAATVPIGSKYPTQQAFRGHYLMRYRREGKLFAKNYIVRAIYGPVYLSGVLPGIEQLQGWSFTISGAPGSIHTLSDLEGRPIGVPAFVPVSDVTGIRTTDSEGRSLNLDATGGFRAIGVDRITSSTVLTLTTTPALVSFGADKFRLAIEVKNRVNHAEWFGVPAGFALLHSFSVQTVAGNADPLNGSTGIAYEVTATIEIGEFPGFPFSPIKRWDSFLDDAGNESLVFVGGNPRESSFDLYRPIDFGSVLTAMLI